MVTWAGIDLRSLPIVVAAESSAGTLKEIIYTPVEAKGR